MHSACQLLPLAFLLATLQGMLIFPLSPCRRKLGCALKPVIAVTLGSLHCELAESSLSLHGQHAGATKKSFLMQTTREADPLLGFMVFSWLLWLSTVRGPVLNVQEMAHLQNANHRYVQLRNAGKLCKSSFEKKQRLFRPWNVKSEFQT